MEAWLAEVAMRAGRVLLGEAMASMAPQNVLRQPPGVKQLDGKHEHEHTVGTDELGSILPSPRTLPQHFLAPGASPPGHRATCSRRSRDKGQPCAHPGARNSSTNATTRGGWLHTCKSYWYCTP